MSHENNITRIKAVSNALGELKDKVVFVGGATVSLYPERQFFEARVTDDIDVIVEIINYQGRVGLEEKLRSLGFIHDIESGIVCRYIVEGIIVDIIPTDDPSMGFGTKWYPEGFQHAVDYKIDKQHSVKILSAPYFIATKLEAFKDRGENDGRTSQDFEDIIFVLENRASVWEEMDNTETDLKEYLKNEFKVLLGNLYIFEWVDSNVERASPPATFSILEKMKKFVS